MDQKRSSQVIHPNSGSSSRRPVSLFRSAPLVVQADLQNLLNSILRFFIAGLHSFRTPKTFQSSPALQLQKLAIPLRRRFLSINLYYDHCLNGTPFLSGLTFLPGSQAATTDF